jgi:hypothetical protein
MRRFLCATAVLLSFFLLSCASNPEPEPAPPPSEVAPLPCSALLPCSAPPTPTGPPGWALEPERAAGRIAYQIPKKMVADHPYFIFAAMERLDLDELSEELDQRLAQDILKALPSASRDDFRFADVEVAPVMKAVLGGEDFEIFAATPAEQPMAASGSTKWAWSVRAKRPGNAMLRLTLSRRALFEGREFDQTMGVFFEIVDVRSSEDIFRSNEQLAQTSTGDDATRQARPNFSPSRPADIPAAASPVATSSAPSDGCQVQTNPARPGHLAFVLGNQNYTGDGVKPLSFALQDGNEIASTLAGAGFNVTACYNLTAEAVQTALSTFSASLRNASEAGHEVAVVFYYAGHGVTTPTKGETYLLPVSLRQATVSLVESQGITVDQVLGGFAKSGARRIVLIFDACRDVLKLEDGDFRGFRPVGFQTTSDDILAYATRFGEKAKDNGLYAQALAKMIREGSETDAVAVFNAVQKEVSDFTGKGQIPDFTDRMPDRFPLRLN